MFNEQKVLAPDRQQGRLGTDNNFEYRLTGYFSGDTVYEPASDGFYPEFVLTATRSATRARRSFSRSRARRSPRCASSRRRSRVGEVSLSFEVFRSLVGQKKSPAVEKLKT